MANGIIIAKRWRAHWLCLGVALLLSACSTPMPCYSPEEAQSLQSIYVIRRAKHTGIAVRASEWPDRSWALLEDFPHARYLEFGWGDARYYQAVEKTVGMTLAAALWPTPSVMEVVGIDELSMQQAPDYEIVEVKVSEAGFRALARSIAASFAGDEPQPTGTARRTAAGQVRFYHARGSFYFPRMCNRWTAERLEVAGCELQTWSVVLASRVIREARRMAAAEAGVMSSE